MLKKINKYPCLLALLLLVLLCAVISYLFFHKNSLLTALTVNKLTTQNESFTELYLDNHQTLPTFLEPGTVATASFTIHNYEHKDENYKFIVTKMLQDTEVISSGVAKLAHNKYKSFQFEFTVATTAAKTKVTILLPDKKQAVHFFINTKR